MNKILNPVDYKCKPPQSFRDVTVITLEQAIEEARAIAEAIKYHNQRYYVENKPSISNDNYDRLFKRLEELERTFPQLGPITAPSRLVGSPVLERFERVKHMRPLFDIPVVHSEMEVRKFFEQISNETRNVTLGFVCEPKICGISLEIVYEYGVFRYGVTQGDGNVGENVSGNLLQVPAFVQRLQEENDIPASLAVRMQMFLPRSALPLINEEHKRRGEELFASTHVAAIALLHEPDPSRFKGTILDCIASDIVVSNSVRFETHWDALRSMQRWGLKTDVHAALCHSFDTVQQYYQTMREVRKTIAYEINGIVIKVDSTNVRDRLGDNEHGPHWAVAWKFSSD